MSEEKRNLEQKAIVGTIELMEAIANNKVNAITLEDGSVFYRAESHVLRIIAQEPGIFSSEIARRFKVTRGAIQKTLGRLEDRKLIVKEIDQADKKRIRLYLTKSGEKSIKMLMDHQMKINSVFFSEISALTEEELVTVNRFLSMARNVLDQMENPE